MTTIATTKRNELLALIKNEDWDKVESFDTGEIEDFKEMFAESKFKGDVSKWDVSKGKDFSGMFHNSIFDGDISKWDVSKGKDFSYMFAESSYTGTLPAGMPE